MKLSYDHENDVLYLTFDSSKEPCRYIEIGQGDLVRIGRESGEVHGVTILSFKEREGSIEIPTAQSALEATLNAAPAYGSLHACRPVTKR